MDLTKVVIFALNECGNGGPVASEETLQFFQKPYIRACLLRMTTDNRLTEVAHAAAEKALKDS